VDLVLFTVWCFLVAFGGGLVGLVLGNLRLPATLLLASSPAAGAGANLAISAAAAGTASVAHIRAGRIDWHLVGWMLPPSILGAVGGGYLSGVLPGDLLLLVIAAVLLQAGVSLLRNPPAPKPAAPPSAAAPLPDGEPDPPVDVRAAVVTGLVIGVIGGVVGLILGSLRMPALLRFVGATPQRAVGTNVTVGLFVGIAGALGHLPNAAPDLDVMALGIAASIPGAALGSRLTGRLSDAQLIRAIAVILLVVAVSMVVQALT